MNNFWEKRWQAGQTGWDLGMASPPLTAYAGQIPLAQRSQRVLIPGCGNGYEAVWLLHNGFSDVTLIDIAPTAVEHVAHRLHELAPDWEPCLQVVCGDFFECSGQFELILEQTFFCALHPDLRENYARKMHELLLPGGKLAGVLFDKDFEGGPPFGGHAEEYRQLFEPFFRIKTLAPCTNSIAPRAGAEVFIILEK